MRGKANHMRLLLCVLSLTWSAKAEYGGGTGEPNDSYLIYNAEQMDSIGAEHNDWDKHFKLMADIDLGAYAGTDFNIIGTGRLPSFSGTFDGGGHTISNFTYTSVDKRSVGLFGYIDDPKARISNLGLIDPNVDGGIGIAVGSLVGWLAQGTVTDCYAVNGSISGRSAVGGLVGNSSGTIRDCHATGNVAALYSVGGLVGYNRKSGGDDWSRNTGVVERCFSAGIVIGVGAVGGLVGTNNEGTVIGSSSTAGTTGGEDVGGLVGGNSGLVANSYSKCDVEGEDRVGGLVGRNDGVVIASSSHSSVNGAKEVSGLVGYNSLDGEIQNSYATGNVIGQEATGGLVGTNVSMQGGRAGVSLRTGKIRHCYSVAAVLGDNDTGGLIGRDDDGGSAGCFWDVEASGQSISAGGLGKTTAEMHVTETFVGAGWDFWGEAENGVDDIWAEPPEGGYPILWWQRSPLPELPLFSGGRGALDDPYLISTADELNSIGSNPRLMEAHFKLVNDVDLIGVELFGIASQWHPFSGTFDGNDHTISNFNHNSGGRDNVGLFGCVGHPDAEIKNLRLVGSTVDGRNSVGSLVGRLGAGSVVNCSVEGGLVGGRDNVGGLVGECNPAGIVTRCRSDCGIDGRDNTGGLVGRNSGILTGSYSKAGVTGRNAVGGLVGRNSPGEVLNSYAAGEVAGQWYVGGLVGSNSERSGRSPGIILNCYSATAMLAGYQTGGLVGASTAGGVYNSFWDIEASGRIVSWGGTGKTTAEMQTTGTFLDAGWDFVNETKNGTEDIWCICEEPDYPTFAGKGLPQ
ncbi:MAG: hypothetical protein ISS70_09420 [Phycisphaerae bacterium]|nr:hypothetical protein [Phycisphaerae bacterium]